MQFKICDFGAVGDGKFDNTSYIQKAIDACAEAGGGTVLIPPGDFSTDMLTLHDNIELHLETESRLLSLLKPVPQPDAACKEPSCNTRRYLIGGAN